MPQSITGERGEEKGFDLRFAQALYRNWIYCNIKIPNLASGLMGIGACANTGSYLLCTPLQGHQSRVPARPGRAGNEPGKHSPVLTGNNLIFFTASFIHWPGVSALDLCKVSPDLQGSHLAAFDAKFGKVQVKMRKANNGVSDKTGDLAGIYSHSTGKTKCILKEKMLKVV